MAEGFAYYVTLHKPDSNFVWRAEVFAPTEELARFMFMREWLGMIISQDIRPSELTVEKV